MTVWHWVRHGPTHQKTFVGWRDVPADLSDTQALQRLKAYLPQDAIVISSDLSRSVETANAIADGRRRLPHDPHLRELHFGDWDGRHFSDVSATDPELSRTYWESPGHHRPPGGESWDMAAARVASGVARINTLFPGRHIIAVAHFGVILTQVQACLSLTAQETLGHKIDNLSVTSLDLLAGKALTINHRP